MRKDHTIPRTDPLYRLTSSRFTRVPNSPLLRTKLPKTSRGEVEKCCTLHTYHIPADSVIGIGRKISWPATVPPALSSYALHAAIPRPPPLQNQHARANPDCDDDTSLRNPRKNLNWLGPRTALWIEPHSSFRLESQSFLEATQETHPEGAC